MGVVAGAIEYVRTHAALLCWHRLYDYPVLRLPWIRPDVGLDGFRR